MEEGKKCAIQYIVRKVQEAIDEVERWALM